MLIEFGIINYKLLLPFIYPIFIQIRKYIHKDDKTPFFEFFTNYCGYLCQGIVYLIMLKQMKKAENNIDNIPKKIPLEMLELVDKDEQDKSEGRKSIDKSFINQIKLEADKIHKKNKCKKYLNLLALTGIYLIPLFLDSYTTSQEEISFKTGSSISVLFCIIAYVVLSRLILGAKIFSHQILSLVIIIICTILSIVLILMKDIFNLSVLADMGLMAVIYTFYALFNVLEKRHYNIYMNSPYHLMFFIGLLSVIILLIYETITVLAYSKDEVFNGIFLQLETNFKSSNYYIFVLLADILSAFIWILGIHLTVYFLTPSHLNISESISQIISTFINNYLEGLDISIKIIIYALFIIIVFFSLVYNEIIVINACSLNKNTKKFIENRANLKKELMEDGELSSNNTDSEYNS